MSTASSPSRAGVIPPQIRGYQWTVLMLSEVVSRLLLRQVREDGVGVDEREGAVFDRERGLARLVGPGLKWTL